RERALLNMAAHHGPVTAVDAARLLNVTVGAADAMLTDLAKRDPDRLAVDVDDQGVVWYRIARPFLDPAGAGVGQRLRVEPGGADGLGRGLTSDDSDDRSLESEISGRRNGGGHLP